MHVIYCSKFWLTLESEHALARRPEPSEKEPAYERKENTRSDWMNETRWEGGGERTDVTRVNEARRWTFKNRAQSEEKSVSPCLLQQRLFASTLQWYVKLQVGVTDIKPRTGAKPECLQVFDQHRAGLCQQSEIAAPLLFWFRITGTISRWKKYLNKFIQNSWWIINK